jgi:DNA-binding response OmpR family regulator
MSHTKVLMIGGLGQNIDLLKVQEAGADGYITKPFLPTDLVDKIEVLLERN